MVPMAIEEPSVVAAASASAKFIKIHGGFKCTSTENIVIAQLQLLDANPNDVIKKLLENKMQIISKGNELIPTMVKREGGIKNLEAYSLDPIE